MEVIKLKKSNYKNAVEEAVAVLKKGGLVVSPSDTVYGILVDATNEDAIKKLIELKERPKGRAISVFVKNISSLTENVRVNDHQLNIIKELLPGPYTLVLDSKHNISLSLESENKTLGIRIPDFKFVNDISFAFKKSLTATSANLSGRSPHYDVKSFLRTLSSKKKSLIDLVIDAGKLPRNKPSTVIDLTSSKIKVIREGDIKFGTSKIFISKSEGETKNIAKEILNSKLQIPNSKDPLVFVLRGDLGAGKTVFVKGIGEALNVSNIISPTFVIYYEYPIRNGKLLHADLYNIKDPDEFKYLKIEEYLKKGNILCIEWGEKAGEIQDALKKKGMVINVDISYINENKRKITINY